MKRNEDSLRDLWDIKHSNIHIMGGVPKGKEKEIMGGPKRRRERERPMKMFEERVAEKLINMGKETVTQVQEVQRPIQD